MSASKTHIIGNFTRVVLLSVLFAGENNRALLAASTDDHWLAPNALAASSDGKSLFVACAKVNRVLRLDVETGRVLSSIAMPFPPSGLAPSTDGSRLFVACAAPESAVCVVDITKDKIIARIPAGHTAGAPVIGRDGKTLFVCNRFNNDVSMIDVQTRKAMRRIPVQREPVAAALTTDGRFLLVANLLPKGRADAETVAAEVSVIDTSAGRVVNDLVLPDGSNSLQDMKVSPDGKYAVVTHILSRYHLPTDQVERGWMNANAFSIIDLASQTLFNTVLLDEVGSGAGNPWGIGWSPDGSKLVIAHAGTHELSIIDFPALIAKLEKLPQTLKETVPSNYGTTARIRSDVPNDLSFLVDLRRRVKLPDTDRGPRPVVVTGGTVFIGNYFSDTISKVDLSETKSQPASIPLNPRHKLTVVEKGEAYFHDATLCLQGWQSCSSCHPGDARVDGLNWDLLNDGVGNPKNTKSLLLCFKTPPCMSLGVRERAEDAVRAGIEHILFTHQPEEVPAAIDEYLKSLTPMASPSLIHGHLSRAAQRGRRVFQRAGCAACHPSGLFTDLRAYDVGTHGRFDAANDKFYTPTLVELWRTAPYLHDGSAATVRDVVTVCNHQDQHGKTSKLTTQEIDDLCAYLLSL
jgi:YVTN family beta-propeller protein